MRWTGSCGSDPRCEDSSHLLQGAHFVKRRIPGVRARKDVRVLPANLLARLRRAIWFYLPSTRCKSFSLSRHTDSSRSPSRYSCGTIVTVQGLVYALGSSNVN